jgi:riboflavin kinase/FMN adenylyltransferase
VVAPGNYDGVHLGHRALIRAALERAGAGGLRTVALTFDPHPAQVVSSSRVPPLLTTIERRSELLRRAGADEVVVQPFGREFAALSPERFLQTSMIEKLGAEAVVVGADFRFGKDRAGDIHTLRELGRKYGFEVIVVDPVQAGAGPVSSSEVRKAVMQGDMERAALYLNRFHDLSGEVVQGDGRGKKLGAPTANLVCEPVLQPPDGVYAVAARRVEPAGTELVFGVANLGVRPTFGAGRSLEVHLFDFEGDLYGARLRVAFVHRLREERTFADAEQLRAQIEADLETGRRVLQAADKEKLSWI